MQSKPQNTGTIGGEKLVRGQGIYWRRLPLAALLAALAAAVMNATVYFAASGFGFITRDVLVPLGGGEMPLTVSVVVIASIIGAIGGAVLFALIGLFARHPVRRVMAPADQRSAEGPLFLSEAHPELDPDHYTREVGNLATKRATLLAAAGLLPGRPFGGTR